jgi:hypothetical protein
MMDLSAGDRLRFACRRLRHLAERFPGATLTELPGSDWALP